MYAIVGLGNPGEKYTNTKHNLGVRVVENIANESSSGFKLNKPLKAEIANATVGGTEVILAKPITFMNRSGEVAVKLVTSYRLRVMSDVVVVHDDISMELGTVKISQGSGAGKHHGVQSVIDHLGTKDFIRVRLGIGRGHGDLKEVVLSQFRSEELTVVYTMVENACNACKSVIVEGLEKAMNVYN
jgi:peptidyl-tRNA hydrolase, PTH1 family